MRHASAVPPGVRGRAATVLAGGICAGALAIGLSAWTASAAPAPIRRPLIAILSIPDAVDERWDRTRQPRFELRVRTAATVAVYVLRRPADAEFPAHAGSPINPDAVIASLIRGIAPDGCGAPADGFAARGVLRRRDGTSAVPSVAGDPDATALAPGIYAIDLSGDPRMTAGRFVLVVAPITPVPGGC